MNLSSETLYVDSVRLFGYTLDKLRSKDCDGEEYAGAAATASR